jgi:hypothetical protein
MSGFADYEQYDALGLADLVRRGKVGASDLLDAAIERVEARNPALNAVVTKLYDYGRRAIAEGLPDGPFRGVPFLMKDLTSALADVTMTRGSRFADTAPAAADSEHVKRLKRTGLVIFGRTNTPSSPVVDVRAACTGRPAIPDVTRISGGRVAVPRRRWPPACCRWRTPPTDSARFARRRRAAAWWG